MALTSVSFVTNFLRLSAASATAEVTDEITPELDPLLTGSLESV